MDIFHRWWGFNLNCTLCMDEFWNLPWESLPKQKANIPQTLLAFLCPAIYGWCTSSNFRCVCRLFNGWKVWLQRWGNFSIIFNQCKLQYFPRSQNWTINQQHRREKCVDYWIYWLDCSICWLRSVENSNIAVVLYIIDHLFFAIAIAQKTYFQKIANPAHIASTAGVLLQLVTLQR